MFRSKGFTIAFTLLSILIIALLAILIYLVFGKGSSALIEEYNAIAHNQQTETEPEPQTQPTEPTETQTEPPTETTEEPTEPTINSAEDYTIRPLYVYQDHKYPVMGENIPERGVLTITQSGDNGEGLVFHKKAAFDHESTPGNQTIFSGTFNITDKVYIIDNNRPYVMYHTEDDYYVTGSTTYVKYEIANTTTVTPKKAKVTTYGLTENEGIAVRVYYEDGNHVVFSVFDYVNDEMTPVLANVIAAYNDDGSAHFEYHNKDGRDYNGILNFESINDEDSFATYRIQLIFDSPIDFVSGARSDFVLHNN